MRLKPLFRALVLGGAALAGTQCGPDQNTDPQQLQNGTGGGGGTSSASGGGGSTTHGTGGGIVNPGGNGGHGGIGGW
jgi:hypothetical protein